MSYSDSTRTTRARETAIARRKARQAKLAPQPLDLDALARDLAKVPPIISPTPRAAADALTETRATGGSTLWIVPPWKRGRYVLSLPLTETIPLTDATPWAVSDIWRSQLRHATVAAYLPHSFGLWADGPTLHVDVNTSTNDLVEAFTLARDHDQLAVWDNAKSIELAL